MSSFALIVADQPLRYPFNKNDIVFRPLSSCVISLKSHAHLDIQV